MSEKSPENKERPNASEQRPRDTNEATRRAIGSAAIKGAQKK
jgi:hypothetical protein